LVRVRKVAKRVGESGEMVIVMVQKEFKWGKWEMARVRVRKVVTSLGKSEKMAIVRVTKEVRKWVKIGK